MYQIAFSKNFQKVLHKLRRSGKFNETKLAAVLRLLVAGNPLPEHHRDHSSEGNLQDFRECHVGGDLLLLYKRNVDLKLIVLSNIGSHHELLGR